jgi:WD40 repeat protein
MWHRVLALVALGFALAPVRAADPKPLWEIDTTAKGETSVLWVEFTPDGKTLLAQIEERTGAGAGRERLVARDVKTREERVLAGMSSRGALDMGWRSNPITKSGIVLIPCGYAQAVRVADGKGAPVRASERNAVAAWATLNGSEAVWLLDRGESRYELAVATVPSFDAQLNKPDPNERWATVPLPAPKGDRRYSAITLSPDATLLASAARDDGNDHTLSLHTLVIGPKPKLTEVASVSATQKGGINTMRFSPDGKTLATGSGDSSVALWDVEKPGKEWKPRATVATGNFTVGMIAFSPDGRTVAACTFERKGRANLFLIDVTAGKLLASHRLAGAVMALAYSPDGKVLVTGNSLGHIQAWDAEAVRKP